MSKKPPVNTPPPAPSLEDVAGFDSPLELALALRSSWNHANDTSWRPVDPALWAPVVAAIHLDAARIRWRR